jgi:NitT/TauT family transport system substrate-binding protein
MRRRTIIKSSALFGLGALGASVFSSCVQPNDNSSTSTSTSTSTATSKGLKPLRVGLLQWLGWEGMYIADVKKLFAAEGIEVQQTIFKSITEINDALLAGKLDIAAIGGADIFGLNAKVPNIKIIMVTDYSGEVDGILSSNKIIKPEDLKGKKIAVEDLPYEHVFVGEFLKRGGLTEKDVQIVSLSAEEGAKAFMAGKVDAVATYDPFITKALKARKDAKQLFSPKGTSIIANSIAAHGKVIEERRNDVLAYLRAIDKGSKLAKANLKEANDVMSKWLELSVAEIVDQRSKIYTLDITENKIVAFNASNALNLESSLRSASKILLDGGRIKAMGDAATFIDGSLIKSL